MLQYIGITPASSGSGEYEAGAGGDLFETLAEALGDVDAVEIDDDAELPDGAEDIRGRIRNEPDRIFVICYGRGDVGYFGPRIVEDDTDHYRDQYGRFFGRADEAGNVMVLHVEDGEPARRLDASVYPIGSFVSARYDHPAGIILSRADADRLGIQIED